MKLTATKQLIKPVAPQGFTIIETMIVLVLASLTLIIIFLAVPALQRNVANNQRDHDAARLVDAINECLLAHSNNVTLCDEPDELPITPADLQRYTGFHYGRTENPFDPTKPIQVSPTLEEPNWLFRLVCTPNHQWFTNTNAVVFVVTYYRDTGSGGFNSRCLDG
ncbi:MAG: prepilin-type N-terminal cleavage/methylation domain-containing protein [Candidatus Saccharimonadales bacterium]